MGRKRGRRSFALYCSLFLLVGMSLFLRLTSVSEKEQKHYQKLVAQEEERKKGESFSALQRREGVQKDLFYSGEGTERLRYCLRAPSAEMWVDAGGGRKEVREHLQEVQGWMQSRSSYRGSAQQAILYFQASEGVYYQQRDQFVANDLFLVHATAAPGDFLVDADCLTPLVKGKASRADLMLVGGSPHFQAENFQGILCDCGGGK